jgi:hypothetical protein
MCPGDGAVQVVKAAAAVIRAVEVKGAPDALEQVELSLRVLAEILDSVATTGTMAALATMVSRVFTR